jgi:hypothetical protein
LIEVETKFPFANSISAFSRSQDPGPTLSGSRYLHLLGKIGVVFRRKKSK